MHTCVRNFFDHTHQYVNTPTYSTYYITAIIYIECCCYLGLSQLWYVITHIDNYDVDL